MTPEYTLDEWMQGIAAAERAGDMQAATFLRREAQKALTGEGTLTERFGAGMQDVIEAGKRWFGGSKEDLAEHNRIAKMADPGGWGRLGGQVAALAPTALIPGAASIPGSAAIGGATGAFMDPEDPLKGGALGAAGGAAGAAAFKALPAAGRAVRDSLAERTPLFPGRRQELAEEAFRRAIPEAERAGVAADLRAYADPTEIPGFRQTTAAATRNPTLLEMERSLRSQGQTYGEPLRRRVGEQADAVNSAWESQFGGGESQAAKDIRDVLMEQHKAGMTGFSIEPRKRNVQTILQAFETELETAVGSHRNALRELRDDFVSALKRARATDSIEPLDYFRRVEIKEKLNRLYRASAGDAAGYVRRSLERLKPIFNEEMDQLISGVRPTPAQPGPYSQLIQDYHQLSKEVGQREASEAWLDRLRSRPEMAAEGVRDPIPLLPALRKEFAGGGVPTTRFNTPTYTPQHENLLRQTLDALEASTRSTGARDIIPPNSATAANLQPINQVLRQAEQAQKNAAQVSTGEAVFGAGGLMPGSSLLMTAGAAAKHWLADPMRARATDDIAKRLVTMFAEPSAALAALERAQLPDPMKQAIALRIAALVSQTGAIGAANPQ